MVVLADEILESFFETDFSNTFRLEPVPLMELPNANASLLGGIWQNIATDDNRKIFNKLSDELGRAVGRHQVFTRPAIGKYTSLEEPKARESLLTPTMRRSASRASLTSSPSDATIPMSASSGPGQAAGVVPAISTSPSTLGAVLAAGADSAVPPSAVDGLSPMPSMFQAAANAAALMERTPFAIDDAKDDDDESDDESDEDDVDDGVMDEVDAFLEAHDSGLTEAERELAQGASCRRQLVLQ